MEKAKIMPCTFLVSSITYYIGKPGLVSLSIYSLSGKQITNLLKGYSASGRTTYAWDGTDGKGNSVPDGCYMAVLNSNKQTLVESVMFMR